MPDPPLYIPYILGRGSILMVTSKTTATATVSSANTAEIKSIMHDWSDEDCIKILKNCKKSIREDKGEVIIAEFVVKPEGKGLFDDTGLIINIPSFLSIIEAYPA
ncbi:hypothetical protein K1719_031311 [Acacia pycnantha]|nr:hypothetical protein K1719_031311 [Acacia pycnantha]